MDSSQIHVVYNSALYFLAKGQISAAISKTEVLTIELQVGEYTDRLVELEQNYHFLLQYYITGVDDPERKSVYNRLIAKLFTLIAELREELLFRNSTNFEYTQKRYFPYTKKYKSATELLFSLRYYHSQSILISNLQDSHELEKNRLRSNYETALSELFNLFWITSFYESDEKKAFEQILNESYLGFLEKSILISALTLNIWRMFDERKIMMLLDACQSENQMVKQRAMVGLSFVMARYERFLPYFPAIRNRLVLLADDSSIVDNFQNIIIQIISTAETEKISKKMQEEILPEMMKMSPMMKDKMDPETLLNSDEWSEANPEWQEMMDKSGISDKLKELSELQMEGADVYMSTFSLLKNFTFFSETSNWFLPFDTTYSTVKELFKQDDNSLISAFVGNNVMCNSDKYSFCLSILQMPESQRGLLKNSFKMEAEQLAELTNDEALLNPNIAAKNISKQYIQDLFRFFKLYSKHGDFADMFSYSLSLHHSFLFDILSNDRDFKLGIAEYYFSKSHYSEALELFEEIQHEITPSASIYQKIGYMYQQTSKFEKALDAYNKADIIQPDDIWTVRKMALCNRLSGNFERALEFYQHVDYLKPNQNSVLMQIAHCLVELKKFKEALNIYFKLDAIEGDNEKVWRAITWCSFVSGNLKQADYYLGKLLENEPNALDFMNAAHVVWCQKDHTKAISLYQKSIELQENNRDLFLSTFNEDKSYLIANGVDKDEIPLMLDALLVSSK